MRNAISAAAALAMALLLAHCATAAAPDTRDARKVVGTEEGIRVEGEIFGDAMASGQRLPISWSITNEREVAIAVADIVAESSYDPETRTVTVGVGAEVPGEQLVPRLVRVAPGETKTFGATASYRYVGGAAAAPAAIRLRVNFLSDVTPFARLLEIREKAIADAAYAAEIFPVWVEKTESVFTSAVPVRWDEKAPDDPISARRR